MEIKIESVAGIIAQEYRKHYGQEVDAVYCEALTTRLVEYIKGQALLAILDQIGVRDEGD